MIDRKQAIAKAIDALEVTNGWNLTRKEIRTITTVLAELADNIELIEDDYWETKINLMVSDVEASLGVGYALLNGIAQKVKDPLPKPKVTTSD